MRDSISSLPTILSKIFNVMVFLLPLHFMRRNSTSPLLPPRLRTRLSPSKRGLSPRQGIVSGEQHLHHRFVYINSGCIFRSCGFVWVHGLQHFHHSRACNVFRYIEITGIDFGGKKWYLYQRSGVLFTELGLLRFCWPCRFASIQ
jgi:hypothetical protein